MAEQTDKIALRYALDRGSFSLDAEVELPMRGITGVYGHSGAGKTTLLRCIAGLEEPDEARLQVRTAVWDDSARNIRLATDKREIAYVFQEPRLFPHLSVESNLRYGEKRSSADASTARFKHVIDLLGIAGFLKRAPATLSGGEAQRVAIGRALLRSPELILMDEPLASVDEARRDEVLPFIEALHADTDVPIIYVSHNINEICRVCDQLAIMEEGRIMTHGSLQSVLLRTDLPLLGGREASALLHATVQSYEQSNDLSRLTGAGSDLWVTGNKGPAGTSLRLRIRANDVSLCLERPQNTSILNVIDATVEKIQEESAASALVHLCAGDATILARVTRKSCAELSLRQGLALYAQIKSIATKVAHVS